MIQELEYTMEVFSPLLFSSLVDCPLHGVSTVSRVSTLLVTYLVVAQRGIMSVKLRYLWMRVYVY